MATVQAAADSLPRNLDLESPNWNDVPFMVGCARCGADLRGATEPKCRACGLKFDWADAVPIDKLTCAKCGYHLRGLRKTRCPECGKEFTWDEALARYHRTRLPYFEYRWREQPLRSFVRTWWLCLWPRRLWRTMQLHDPPQVGALLLQFGITLFCLQLVVTVLQTLAFFFFLAWVNRLLPIWNWLPATAFEAFDAARSARITKLTAVWSISTVGALLVFQQSMRQLKIRNTHVLRAVVYSLPSAITWVFPSMLLSSVAFYCLTTTKAHWYIYSYLSVHFLFVLLSILLLIITSARSVKTAYMLYIEMPRARSVIIASQIIAALVVLIADLLDTSFLQQMGAFG